MQKPTLEGVRIRSTHDAFLVFTAVANGRLPLITRRLDAEERRSITSGNVYVWEERGASITEANGFGMERWTDGMGWGPSRVRDVQEFLFYHQKETDGSEEFISPVTPWVQMIRRQEESTSRASGGGTASTSRSLEGERLTKQTFSVHISLPREVPRKWHLTAYFSQKRLASLDTIDAIRGVGDVVIPDGWFRSARSVKRRDHRKSISSAYPSDLLYNPSSSSLNHTSPSNPVLIPTPRRDTGKLVPLEYLQNASGTRRNPVDEQILKRFSSRDASVFTTSP